jgi:hypothetical protein
VVNGTCNEPTPPLEGPLSEEALSSLLDELDLDALEFMHDIDLEFMDPTSPPPAPQVPGQLWPVPVVVPQLRAEPVEPARTASTTSSPRSMDV